MLLVAYVLAFACFLGAALGMGGKYNLVGAGLAILTATLIIANV